MTRIFLLTCLLAIVASCVSKKKYDEMVAQKVRTEADLADRNTSLDKANADLANLQEQLRKLKDDTTNLGIDVRNTSHKLASLEKEHDQLNSNYKNLLTNSGRLNRDMAEQEEQL